MSVETAIGASIGSAVGTSIGAVESGISGSIGPALSITPAIETGLSTTFSPETLSGGLNKSISMAEILATSVPYGINTDNFNPDRVVPGAPRMVFDSRLFSTLARPIEAPTVQTASSISGAPASTASSDIQEFLLPESLRAEISTETHAEPAVVSSSLLDVIPSRRELEAVHEPRLEAVADQKLALSVISQIRQLFPEKPEAQALWEKRVESAVNVQSTETDNVTKGDKKITTTPKVAEEEAVQTDIATNTEMIEQSAPPDINEPPPSKPFEEKTVEPEPDDLEPRDPEEPRWNTYALQETWQTAKESLKRRLELARAIVGNAFSQDSAMPAAQVVAEAPLLDLPDPEENLQIFRGKLRYPAIQYEVQLRAIASGTSFGQTEHAVASVVYKNAPTEKHSVQRFLEQKAQSKLVMPAKKLAEAGAKVIVLKKRRIVWESAKRRVGIHPIEMERARQKAA